MEDMTRTCPACGTTFTLKRSPSGGLNKKKKYCDLQCWKKDHPREVRENSAKGGVAAADMNAARLRATRKPDSKSYVKDKGRHEHRTVAEQMIGRPLAPGEVVHHEDCDKTNNSPDNLIVFPTQAEHYRHHSLGHPEGRNLPCSCIHIKKQM